MILEPGDLVKHLVNGEEGFFVRLITIYVGTNKAGGCLINVRGEEKVWLEGETGFVERAPKKPEP